MLDVRMLISLLIEVMLLSVLLFQDRFNGMIARKNTLAGTKEYHVAFGEDSYTVVTAATTSTFRYELIDALAESCLLYTSTYNRKADRKRYLFSEASGCSAAGSAHGSGP